MNQMEIFKNPEFGAIRAVEIDGEPWLVGKDVALALGYKNPQEAIRLLKQLETLRIPHYSHAAQWMGRAYAAAGDLPEALRWFEREDLYFPVGALTAGLRLMVLKQMRAPRAEQLEAERDFLARLQLKDLTPDHFSLLFRYPQIDDNAIDRERILKQWEAGHGHDAR